MPTSPLATAIDAYTRGRHSADGFYATELAPLRLMRVAGQTLPQYALYTPTLCLTVQGAKQAMLGDALFNYGAMEFLIVSVDLPILGRITQASGEVPFLALILSLDIKLLQEVVAQLDADTSASAAGHASHGVFVGQLEAPAADCLLRLMQLLDDPRGLAMLAPSIVRELYYWLLSSKQGDALRQLAAPDSHTLRIAEAINLMQAEFAAPIGIERLASRAGMSASSFHAHFKSITSVTPLQYQKQLRLLQARRLLVTRAANVSQAAYQVGYESASQFSREYARMFGTPPSRETVAD
ncbi:AraC family transcriptional regulator [Janthinobacterium psychrotolerans]|uniref:AraC-type DNA-binding protein n=1 Tax=Janthinobacterium psychrotolerans TaxID=1747903 RepID=A0A1A7C6J6_9BURK|nr:AraC family transcriptional regulator [Janthinobacterium psychrotolerans]OBV41526.1 AraC-type DNA-binding protein [Janthinobacterium psychrotolerans]